MKDTSGGAVMNAAREAVMPQARGIAVRPAQDRDIGTIAAIYGHHVRHGTASFETEPPPPAPTVGS